MAISKKIQHYMEKASWIRKMFEEGANLKKKYGFFQTVFAKRDIAMAAHIYISSHMMRMTIAELKFFRTIRYLTCD